MQLSRRQTLTTGTTAVVVGLAGCATVQKELGLVDEGDVIDRVFYVYGSARERPDKAPDRDTGIWYQLENVSDNYTVADATYTLFAETESERILEETVTLSNLGPDETTGWYFELTEEETENVTSYGSGFDTFELE